MPRRSSHTTMIPSAEVLREAILGLESEIEKLRILLKIAEEFEQVDQRAEEKRKSQKAKQN